MITSTTTGSILAATLSMPDDAKTNGSYYSSDVIKLFTEHGPKIFYKQVINQGLLWIVTVISAMIGSFYGLRLGIRLFANPKADRDLRLIKRMIRELKSLKKKERKTVAIRSSIMKGRNISSQFEVEKEERQPSAINRQNQKE